VATLFDTLLTRYALSQGIPTLEGALGALGGGPSSLATLLAQAQAEESRRRLTHEWPSPNPYLGALGPWWQGVQERAGELAYGVVNFPQEAGKLLDPAYMATKPLPDPRVGLELALNFLPGAALTTRTPRALATEPLDLLAAQEKAIRLERAGFFSPEGIRRRTGWYRDAAGEWQRDPAPDPLEQFMGGLKREAGQRLPTAEEQLADVARRTGWRPTQAATRAAPTPTAPAPATGPRVTTSGGFSVTPEEMERIRAAQQSVAETQRRARERAQAQRPLSQTFGTPTQQKKAETLFKGLAARPESFQFGGAPASVSIHDIVAHYSTQKNPLKAESIRGEGIRITNERTGGYLTINEPWSTRVHIRSSGAQSQGKEQAGGTQMYQAALSWIANRDYKLKPDPGGISTINRLRKVENTIASYLRHGKEGYIDLSNATEARTLKELLVESKNMVFGRRADLEEHFYFDGETFRRAADGAPVGKGELTAAIEKRDPTYAQGIGETTLKRALLVKWAMGAPLKKVKEAAKKFKEPGLFYGLAGLAVARGEEDNR
jgi:hypothetical protein